MDPVLIRGCSWSDLGSIQWCTWNQAYRDKSQRAVGTKRNQNYIYIKFVLPLDVSASRVQGQKFSPAHPWPYLSRIWAAFMQNKLLCIWEPHRGQIHLDEGKHWSERSLTMPEQQWNINRPQTLVVSTQACIGGIYMCVCVVLGPLILLSSQCLCGGFVCRLACDYRGQCSLQRC